jgi:hypothetical protein
MNRIDIKQNARKQLSANYWTVLYFTFIPMSFLRWFILGLITLNILNVLYTIPYLQLSTAGFYQELKMTS